MKSQQEDEELWGEQNTQVEPGPFLWWGEGEGRGG